MGHFRVKRGVWNNYSGTTGKKWKSSEHTGMCGSLGKDDELALQMQVQDQVSRYFLFQ